MGRDAQPQQTESSDYECHNCGHQVNQADHPVECPECGGTMRNRGTPFE